QAPGEANTELAYLNRAGLIDAIISEDGDCFLFGAKTVLCGICSLILVALLCGGDYDMKGLPGCGLQTALMLACAGLGDTLLTAALTSTPCELKSFVRDWCSMLENEFKTNTSGYMRCKHPLLANHLPQDFPPAFPCLREIAHYCETHFLWGSKSIIL
ncbi:hypothetical protein K439DRAFT_1333229, partial [Ramaria rubella]